MIYVENNIKPKDDDKGFQFQNQNKAKYKSFVTRLFSDCTESGNERKSNERVVQKKELGKKAAKINLPVVVYADDFFFFWI